MAKDAIIIFLTLLGLNACRARDLGQARALVQAPVASLPEAAYRPPPTLLGAADTAGGRLRLFGQATPGARVRLASPEGQAAYAATDSGGVWRLPVPAAAEVRLFGLAMVDQGRAVQSEGYVALTPSGDVAQLRAGAGAIVLHGGPLAQPSILAIDFDSKGGAIVSGLAAPHATLDVSVDGAARGRGRAGPSGHFSVALDEPMSFTDHHLEVIEGDQRAQARARLDPPAAVSGAPYRAAPVPEGWRIDWITPGGGRQTTLLLTRPTTKPSGGAA